MNFNPEASDLNIPELNWRFGYPAVLVFLNKGIGYKRTIPIS
jgi:hypothetical protein